MLVLTRKCGEKILVPQYGIDFQVLEIVGQKVRIGISAPSQAEVYRDEVWARLTRQAQLLVEETPEHPSGGNKL